ncbi:MAG: transglutaminase-like domain-containing protein, partial [Gemmataceae bacterium]|nr:transglutaminase-like domain-containing protein [Gemmataceae bacterium]
ETADGKVLSLSLAQSVGGSKALSSIAKVEEGKLRLESNGAKRRMKWDSETLGLYAQERAFEGRKKGDKFSVKSFELAVEKPLVLRAEVKGEEPTDRLVLKGGAVEREPAKLLRAEVLPDKFKEGKTDVQMPGKTVWLDDKGQQVRAQFEFPGLGLVTQYTASEEATLKDKVVPALLPDLGLQVMIPLKRTLSRPDPKAVTWRVTLKDGLKPPFIEDDRQSIGNAREDRIDLRVKAVREPGRDDKAASPGKEYEESSPFIDSDDPAIKKLAEKVAGGEKGAHAKAVALEKWVHDNMRFSASEGFPAASRVCRDLKGDCRQHALLLAALLRAAGVPSRTALGLVYYREPGRSPNLAFHMWNEAWIGGKWLALDAISGKGWVAATHLTMAHHSWAGTATQAPLLPIAQSLGKLSVEIISED